ncbi:MAG: alpha/beta hydrolase [Anaerolineae bacterium]
MSITPERALPQVIPLWPDRAPGSEEWTWEEAESFLPSGDRVIRNVVIPSLTVYRPVNPDGSAVIICPGGAFHFLSIDFEGTKVAHWLTARGVTALVMRYRLLRTDADFMSAVSARLRNPQELPALVAPLYPLLRADISQAIHVARSHSVEWRINPEQAGVLGFSAGAVVTVLSALDENRSARASFIAPIYCGPLPQFDLPVDAPPMFTLCARDDGMALANTRLLFDAYQAANLSAEMHIYSSGGHGFGMKTRGIPIDHWIERFYEWLRAIVA